MSASRMSNIACRGQLRYPLLDHNDSRRMNACLSMVGSQKDSWSLEVSDPIMNRLQLRGQGFSSSISPSHIPEEQPSLPNTIDCSTD